MTKPSIVLADEPTANLDSKTGAQIIALMHQMNQELGTTFVFSTHDPRVVEIADHVVKLQDGTIIDEYFQNGKSATGDHAPAAEPMAQAE